MIRILGTLLGALVGLAFGSFLNVCVSRWPAHESVVQPRSHCRSCGHALRWWENVPVISWLTLKGRCSACRAWIGWRYPIVELSVAIAWGVSIWRQLPAVYAPDWTVIGIFDAAWFGAERMALCWLLIGLAALDLERLWLPDWLTLGGAAVGAAMNLVRFTVHFVWNIIPLHWTTVGGPISHRAYVFDVVVRWIAAMLAAPLVILFVRWVYRSLRGREGSGMGDAKLMLLVAAWLGLSYTFLAFVLGVALAASAAMAVPASRWKPKVGGEGAFARPPLGTLLCVGGIVSALWGSSIIAAYLRWASFY